jgi:hypothetical protein
VAMRIEAGSSYPAATQRLRCAPRPVISQCMKSPGCRKRRWCIPLPAGKQVSSRSHDLAVEPQRDPQGQAPERALASANVPSPYIRSVRR